MSKVEVESCDEVYYPAVSFVGSDNEKETAVKKIGLSSSEAVLENVEPIVLIDVVKNSEKPKRKQRGLKSWRLKFEMAIVALVAVIAVILVGLRMMGYRTFTVVSGSMEPDYPVGALIYVKPMDYKALKVGDVISYVANDDKTVVTHRIVGIKVDSKDSSIIRFETKGDANAAADSKLVHYKNVLGSPIIIIPFIGYFAHNIQQPPGIYIALVVGTLLLAWTFLPGTLEERRKTARKSIA